MIDWSLSHIHDSGSHEHWDLWQRLRSHATSLLGLSKHISNIPPCIFSAFTLNRFKGFTGTFFFKGETDLWMLAWFSIYWADGNVFSYIYEMLFIVPLTGCVGACVRVFAELIPGKMHFGLWNPCVSNLWAARVVNFRLWTTWHWTRRTLRFLIQRKKK